jgi:penicillin-binding protein 1A
LNYITKARFPELSSSLKNKVDCDLYKKDNKILEWLFGKNDSEKKKEFANKEKKEKKGFFKRLFDNK